VLAIFDTARLGAEHNVNPADWMPWLYPPGYLVLILPFGTMSFAAAFLASTLVSVALIGLAMRPFARTAPAVWLALTLAPAYIPALLIGQNSLIWLACLLAALAALRDGRWVLAGVFVGLLTLKPQLGVMIAAALLGAGLWRTILAASATAILIAALPTLAFGPGYWPPLLSLLTEQSERLVTAIGSLSLMVGPFYLMTLAGLPPVTALQLQLALSALCAVIVLLLWRSRHVGFDAKAAGLLLAILISAPYLWYYETAVMAAIGLFLLRSGVLQPRLPHVALLLLLWFGAAAQAVTIFFNLGDGRYLGAVVITPVLLVSAALLLSHVLAARRGTPHPAVP
jgi:arabinofuranan 3-O-arabinosyltransferase